MISTFLSMDLFFFCVAFAWKWKMKWNTSGTRWNEEHKTIWIIQAKTFILLKHMTFHGLEMRCSLCIAYFTTHLDTSAERNKTNEKKAHTSKQATSKMCYLPVTTLHNQWFVLVHSHSADFTHDDDVFFFSSWSSIIEIVFSFRGFYCCVAWFG